MPALLPPFLPEAPVPCRTKPTLFDPPADDEPPAAIARRTRTARRICGACPVADACRAWALTTRQRGVWGGWDDTDRRRARERARNATRRRTGVPTSPQTTTRPDTTGATAA